MKFLPISKHWPYNFCTSIVLKSAKIFCQFGLEFEKNLFSLKKTQYVAKKITA